MARNLTIGQRQAGFGSPADIPYVPFPFEEILKLEKLGLQKEAMKPKPFEVPEPKETDTAPWSGDIKMAESLRKGYENIYDEVSKEDPTFTSPYSLRKFERYKRRPEVQTVQNQLQRGKETWTNLETKKLADATTNNQPNAFANQYKINEYGESGGTFNKETGQYQAFSPTAFIELEDPGTAITAQMNNMMSIRKYTATDRSNSILLYTAGQEGKRYEDAVEFSGYSVKDNPDKKTHDLVLTRPDIMENYLRNTKSGRNLLSEISYRDFNTRNKRYEGQKYIHPDEILDDKALWDYYSPEIQRRYKSMVDREAREISGLSDVYESKFIPEYLQGDTRPPDTEFELPSGQELGFTHAFEDKDFETKDVITEPGKLKQPPTPLTGKTFTTGEGQPRRTEPVIEKKTGYERMEGYKKELFKKVVEASLGRVATDEELNSDNAVKVVKFYNDYLKTVNTAQSTPYLQDDPISGLGLNKFKSGGKRYHEWLKDDISRHFINRSFLKLSGSEGTVNDTKSAKEKIQAAKNSEVYDDVVEVSGFADEENMLALKAGGMKLAKRNIHFSSPIIVSISGEQYAMTRSADEVRSSNYKIKDIVNEIYSITRRSPVSETMVDIDENGALKSSKGIIFNPVNIFGENLEVGLIVDTDASFPEGTKTEYVIKSPKKEDLIKTDNLYGYLVEYIKSLQK